LQVNTYVTVYFGAVSVAMLLVPIVSRLAKRYGLVDTPGLRKVHGDPIPRVGGVTFVIATLALVLPVLFLKNDIGRSFREMRVEFIALLAAAICMFVVGLIDDLRPLRGLIKLSCIVVASLAVCASGATLSSFSVGTLFELETGWAAWPLTVLWIVVITVCMNFIDGLDGLAAGIAAIVCGTIVLLAIWSGQVAMAVLMLALLGGVTGFLFFNFHPAKIFMGDGGSMFLGFLIGAGSVVCQAKTATLVGLAIPFLVLGVPILDVAFAVVRRGVIERRSLFAPDRNHLHHRLLDLGLHQQTVVIVIYAVTVISASIGVFMMTAHGGWSVVLLACGVLLLLLMFVCLYSRRVHETLMTIRGNLAIAGEARRGARNFEEAQVRMRDSSSLQAWWEAVCIMCEQMNFESIELRDRHNDHDGSTCAWHVSGEKFPPGKTLKLTLPLAGNGAAEWEIRARIWIDGYLELGGRQAMLLARLMDEFPPPEQRQEAERLDPSVDITGLSTMSVAEGPS
jgi:UDP-GlcNAc:undecaprenyl-phosphate GlcNAc-1-phosphate transferase